MLLTDRVEEPAGEGAVEEGEGGEGEGGAGGDEERSDEVPLESRTHGAQVEQGADQRTRHHLARRRRRQQPSAVERR